MLLPFVLVSTMVEKLLAADDLFFEIELAGNETGTAASSFIKSPECPVLHCSVLVGASCQKALALCWADLGTTCGSQWSPLHFARRTAEDFNGRPRIVQGEPPRISTDFLAFSRGALGMGGPRFSTDPPAFCKGSLPGFQQDSWHLARVACQVSEQRSCMWQGGPNGGVQLLCVHVVGPLITFVKRSKCCREALRISTNFIERRNRGP